MMRISRLPSIIGSHLWLFPLLALACTCALAVALATEPNGASPGTEATGPTLPTWLPYRSHAGGDQFDPRLDTPVRLWRAGLSLKEVFGAVAEQTGVEIRFWPPGDENERVRVNLYLNADRPPSLRELMAQLAWVTDCAFAYEEQTDGGEPWTYYLLSTSVAGGAEDRLEEAQAAAMEAWWEEWQSRALSPETIEERLADHRAAFGLSTDELIARYAGIDDHLLLTMLDPPRRAAASFVLGLGDEHREQLVGGEWLTLDWAALTSGQQAALRSCLRPMGRRGPRGWAEDAPATGVESWGGRMPEEVYVSGLNFGRVVITARLEGGEDEPGRRRDRFVMAPMFTVVGEGELTPDERVALRRALGETVTDEEADALMREWGEARREEGREQWRERVRQLVDDRIAEQGPVSVEVEETLSSFVLPLDSSTPYALWQIQEAVAAASGLHVISDCFSHPARSLGWSLQALYGEEPPEMSGLLALRLSALSAGDTWMIPRGLPGGRGAGWEWHDSGSFLRFRSLARDLWRASMLPPEMSDRLDAFLDPYLRKAMESQGNEVTVDVDLGLETITSIVSRLSDLQVQQGGNVVCGDPTDKEASYRQGLRAGILRATLPAIGPLRLLATMSEGQWQQLRGAGLRLAYDLTPEQKRFVGLSEQPEEQAATSASAGVRGRPGPSRRGSLLGPGMIGLGRRGMQGMANGVMRLTAESPWGDRAGRRGRGGPGGMGGRQRAGMQEAEYLVFWSEDEVQGMSAIPRVVAVELAMPNPIAQAETTPDN